MTIESLARISVLVAALLALPRSASTQIVSGFAGLGRATQQDIPSPASYSWAVQSLPIAGMSVNIGRSRSTDAAHHPYTTCDSSSWIDRQCVDEDVDGGFSLESAWYGIAYRYRRRSWFVEAGPRRVSYRIGGRLVGLETGRRVQVVFPQGHIGGWGLDVTAGRTLGWLGLSAVARYTHDWVDLHYEVTDVFAPFDRPFSVQSVSMGLEWSPFRM
ncbi:MAG: hypothetical protein Q8K82_16510 [Gemmatimonadaceae bacterium]|nr:hypothetical protein [Gemmatimonadaceae bacterium]